MESRDLDAFDRGVCRSDVLISQCDSLKSRYSASPTVCRMRNQYMRTKTPIAILGASRCTRLATSMDPVKDYMRLLVRIFGTTGDVFQSAFGISLLQSRLSCWKPIQAHAAFRYALIII